MTWQNFAPLLLLSVLSGCPSEPPPLAREVTSGGATAALESTPQRAALSASASPSAAASPSALALLHLDSAPALTPPPPSPQPSSVSPPPRRACRVAALGDSLTDYRSGGGGYLRLLAARCPKSEFINYGKGGDMVNQMRRRFEAEIAQEPPERFTHLIVFGGVNDLYSDETAGRTNAKIQRDLLAIYERARARGWRVVALTVAPWGGFTRYFTPKRSTSTLELNAWIASAPVDAVVDAHALLACGDPERLCPEYAAPFKDGLHFGKKGHDVLGEALYEAEFASCL